MQDPLVDRDCVMLDGKCDCIRLPGNSFPECKKYGKPEEEHPKTCKCEICRYWGA